ncbi:MAG: membrane protein insertase YidC [Rickettsiales bacterium]
MNNNDLKNLLISILLSTMILGSWQYFYESPRKAIIEEQQQINVQKKLDQEQKLIDKSNKTFEQSTQSNQEKVGTININTDKLTGTISLRGLRFNELFLKKYKENINNDSPLVQLFSSKENLAYFSEFGWINSSEGSSFSVPDKNTIWKCNQSELTPGKSIECYWQNEHLIKFIFDISIDSDYLFTIKQTVINNSSNAINLATYGRIYKAEAEAKQFAILHEGIIGVFSGVLKESTYEDLSKSRQETYTNTPGSWAGITHKYWLSALIPDNKIASKTNLVASDSNGQDNYNINYISNDLIINPGKQETSINHLFAGAKEEKLLAKYAQENDFVLFDRAIDFGIFYFITKPLFLLISYFYSLLGNFGLAILAVTLTLKLLMYPLANKSFKSMAKMKELQPKMEQLKQRYAEDKIKFNQEVMTLYKKENVNPASGCLPLLIQIPIFFSLYKVIFISIEMRHAPFYGWIKDLSAQDPTSIWNLFGLMPWHSLGTLDIGLWPIIMGVTMFIQQSLNPAPTDPVQATVMKFMPLVLMVMLYSLPSGLMIYWSFSNILSILQQYMITKDTRKAKV